MPELNPLDDISTYKKIALAAANRGVPAVTLKRMADAEEEAGVTPPAKAENPLFPASAPAAGIPGVTFTKGFSPAERNAQKAALIRKLRERGD